MMSEIIMREVRQGPAFVVCACIHEQQRCDICQDFYAEPDKNSDDYMEPGELDEALRLFWLDGYDDPAQM